MKYIGDFALARQLQDLVSGVVSASALLTVWVLPRCATLTQGLQSGRLLLAPEPRSIPGGGSDHVQVKVRPCPCPAVLPTTIGDVWSAART